MNWKESYQIWKNHFDDLPTSLQNELTKLEKNKIELESSFDGVLSFGTAGLRGIMGVGSNRMNQINVICATLALGEYLKKTFSQNDLNKKRVVIGHDARYHSSEFALIATRVLTSLNIKVFLLRIIKSHQLLWYHI